MTHGSLFSGIGGFDLGFERAGIKTVWQVEIDPFCRRVLERHFPDARRYHNIKRVTRPEYVDIISGGFPCQDISSAGRMRGIDGERSGLWSEMWRIIRIVRPRYVVVENVAALLNRGIERVVGNLAACGYDAEWDCLPAIAFGAPHRRDRIFLVAYSVRGTGEFFTGEREGLRDEPSINGPTRTLGSFPHADALGCSGRAHDEGQASPERGWIEEIALADSSRLLEGRQIARAFGERTRERGEPINLADPSGTGLERHAGNGAGGGGREKAKRSTGAAGVLHPDTERLQAGKSNRGVGISARESPNDGTEASCASHRSFGDWWLVEPDVGRVAHGIPARVDRLKGLGNAIVPQIAEWIGKRILEAEERLVNLEA